MIQPDDDALRVALESIDWQQVVLNGGPPCFHIMNNGKFCLRAERWPGHGASHDYISLAALLTERERELKEALRVAQALIEPLIETDSAMRPEWDDEAERCLKTIQGLLGD